MRLIVITTETFFEGEAEAINLLFENGLEVLHVRKPYATRKETEVFIGQIRKNFHPRIVIHDFYELTQLFDLKGIHLNRRHPDFLPSLRACEAIQTPSPPSTSSTLSPSSTPSPFSTLSPFSTPSPSLSCHSIDEISEAQFCDYVFLSPIFDSLSKAGYKKGFTPEQLNEAKGRKIIDRRVIALGGITAEKIPAVQDYGFGGIAVIGALWGDFIVSRDVNSLLKRFNELKIKCDTI